MEQKPAGLSKYQKFEIVRVHRRDIVGAEYNPRQITDDARERLRKTIKKIGMVQPPVWNRQTGRLVGGHQRLEVLDILHKTDDYELDVAAVDVDDKREVEINLALNNESIMGDFDLDLMADLKDRFELEAGDFKAVGFTDADLDLMFDGDLSAMFEDDKEVKKSKKKIEEIKEKKKQANKEFAEKLSDEYFFVVVCDCREQKEALLKRLRVPEFETYISSAKVFGALEKGISD
jgi:hypothetical protein